MGLAPEGRYGSSVRQKRAPMTPQRVTRPVEFPSLVRSPPTTTGNRPPGFSAEQDEADEAARSTPGNPSTSYKRDVDVLPRLCWHAKPGIVSEIRRLHLVVEERLDLSPNGYLSL